MAVAQVPRWRWTVDAYEAAAGSGVFGPEPRVELIEGEVYEVAPMLPPHASTIRELRHLLSALDEERYTVDCQTSVRLDERSEPEPDLWVAIGPRSAYRHRHPRAGDLVLVAEVSDTTLAHDVGVKVPAYAAAGVPEVWVVSIPERALHRHTDPAGRSYRSVEAFSAGRVHVGGIEVPVEAVLTPPAS